MANNRSSSRIRSDVLASPLASFRGWRLEVDCPGSECPAGMYHRVSKLVAHHPEATGGVVLAEERPGRRLALMGPEVGY